MKAITIVGSERESVGKVATKALRNAGKVPCVIYGGDKPLHFSAEELAFSKLVYTPNAHTVVIDLGNGKTVNAILQDIQFHPVTDRILHIDFYQTFDDKEVTMQIPLRTVGVSPGVLNGGVLRINRRKLTVRAYPKNLPDFIEVDISKLRIGHKQYITALESDDFKFLHPDNTVVAQVRRSRVSVDDEEEDEDEAAEGAPAAEGAAPAEAPAAE